MNLFRRPVMVINVFLSAAALGALAYGADDYQTVKACDVNCGQRQTCLLEVVRLNGINKPVVRRPGQSTTSSEVICISDGTKIEWESYAGEFFDVEFGPGKHPFRPRRNSHFAGRNRAHGDIADKGCREPSTKACQYGYTVSLRKEDDSGYIEDDPKVIVIGGGR